MHYAFRKLYRRLMALLLCLVLVLACVPVAFAAEGICGDDLTWTFDGSTLTITGSGPMDNYSEDSPAPWYSFSSQILRLSLPDGITRIGKWAFADCGNLAAVTIPSTVEAIDDSAFRRCTSLAMLTLNEGLLTIGQCAFEQCTSLVDLRLPNSLFSLKNHAFYMCSGLTYATIPGAVRTVGSGVFAYCSNLLRVDINADVTMPGWSFFGCDKLEIVMIEGKSVDPESLKISTPPQGIPGYNPTGEEDTYEEPAPTEAPAESQPAVQDPTTGFAASENVTTGTSGQQIVENTTVTKTDNSTTVSSTTTTDGQVNNSTTEITSTVQNDQGWKDVVDKVNAATFGGNSNNVDVTVYLPNSDTVSADVLGELANKNVTLNIQTQSGSKIVLDCSQLGEIRNDLILGYTLLPTTDIPEALAGCTVYKLNFHKSMTQNSEIIIRLPGGHYYGTATLFELKKNGDLNQVQSVLVDGAGDSHWYLGSVDEKIDYLIGIDVPGSKEESPIIPEVLYDEYKIVDQATGKEYVITGRSSSWGMDLGQVMSILAVVMISVIVLVGGVMFIWNKKRLKSGYVPDWDDDDDDYE